MKKLFAIVLFAVSASGCKQGLGERCQVNADCASGKCSMADPRVCVDDLNAMMPIDAVGPEAPPPVDAAAVDAASD
jgi:hypothetical protein